MSALQEGQILIPNSRIGYPKLFRPESIKSLADSKPRFGCQIYLPKSDEATTARINKEIHRLAKEKMDGVKPKTKDLFIKDGDGEDGDENTAGHWIISANRAESQGRPQVIDRRRKALLPEDGKPYAGCYCNFVISVYVPKAWGNKVCASLEVVQFAKDGEPFGAPQVDVEDVMPDLGDEDGDDMVL